MANPGTPQEKNLFEVESTSTFLFKALFIGVVFIGATYVFASYQGYPIILILLGVIVAAYGFLTNKTVAGRQIYATGGNRKAAELSGIKTKKSLSGSLSIWARWRHWQVWFWLPD